MKKQLENRWKNISEKLQAQEGQESDDAAALRKYVSTPQSKLEGRSQLVSISLTGKLVFASLPRQLVDRFNCLSCDRPIVKYTHTQ